MSNSDLIKYNLGETKSLELKDINEKYLINLNENDFNNIYKLEPIHVKLFMDKIPNGWEIIFSKFPYGWFCI